MPLVSVIIPCYNHAKYLRQRIDSVLNQSFTDFELILLDDSSTDNSFEIMQQYAHIETVAHIITNKTNSGTPFIQWQKGLKLAKGKYIWIAESDDFASNDFLKKQLEILESNKAIGICFSASNWVDIDNKIIETPAHEAFNWLKTGNQLVIDEFTVGCPIYNASSALFRLEMVSKTNFDLITQFKFTGDWLFWVQIAKDTQVYHLGERLNFFRQHSQNVSTESNKLGLQFSEGFKVVNYIMAHHPISFFKKRKIMAKWASKVEANQFVSVKKALELLPPEVQFWYWILPVFKFLKNIKA